MPQQGHVDLSAAYAALADPTRRAVIKPLGRGPASVNELAKPVEMNLSSFMKRVRFLEGCGMIRTTKSGRTRTCEIAGERLRQAESWLAGQRAVWEGRADRLEAHVLTSQSVKKEKGAPR